MKLKSSFILNESVSEMINDLTKMFDAGEIEGMIVLIKKPDELQCNWTNMDYLERRGALEMMKDDMKIFDSVGRRNQEDE